ncbi:MAG: hypothetical protein M3164_04785 [Actinomycetota bacterium]|nr:hypothetical protein [Actinomycetota bacterium]
MTNESGLPDYVGDHFAYLVRSSVPTRIGQALFLVSGLVNPVLLLLALPNADGEAALPSLTPLIVSGVIFGASFIWYFAWFEVRRQRFREEQPTSYARWYGRRLRPLASRDLLGQLRLLKLHMRYVFLGKEPSPVETLALTMRFVRNSV